MAEPEIIEEWLKRADEDFEFASSNLQDRNQFFGQICFHFHQAAEKYLKAFIIAHDLEFEKIHDLLKLLKTIQKKEPSLACLREACEFLNPFYVETVRDFKKKPKKPLHFVSITVSQKISRHWPSNLSNSCPYPHNSPV